MSITFLSFVEITIDKVILYPLVFILYIIFSRMYETQSTRAFVTCTSCLSTGNALARPLEGPSATVNGRKLHWIDICDWYNIAGSLPVGDGNQRAKVWLTLTKTWVKKQVFWLESHRGHCELIWVPSEHWFCCAFNIMLLVWAVQHDILWLHQWCVFWG